MDPLFQLIANSTQRMTENTQRSSDALRVQHKKETREKGSRANELDSAELSSDLNSMGEDLMGSMDPDLFGRSGGAERFRKAWDEAEEEAERKQEEEQQDGEPQDERREEGQLESQEVPPEPESPEGTPLELPPPGLAEAPQEAEAPSDEPTLPEPEEEAAAEVPEAETPAAVPVTDVVDTSRQARTGPSPEDALAPEDPAPAASDVDLASTSSFSSLLDHSQGFLLAEEKSEGPVAAAEEPPETEEVPALPPALADLCSRLIIGDGGRPAFRRLERLLARFGAGVLRTCLNEKVRVYLLPPGEPLSSHPVVASLLGEEGEGAAYLPETRAVVLEERILTQPQYGFHPALYYFAHAFDHALGGEGYASLKSAAVHASFQSCQQAMAGHSFADSLAGATPAHYFAQAVESYLAENDCQDALWTREDLYDFDRSMYDYVEYLFKRTNR